MKPKMLLLLQWNTKRAASQAQNLSHNRALPRMRCALFTRWIEKFHQLNSNIADEKTVFLRIKNVQANKKEKLQIVIK